MPWAATLSNSLAGGPGSPYRFPMSTGEFTLRRAGEGDFDGWFQLFEAVAAEGRWIGRELPVDREQQRRRFIDGLAGPEGPAAAFIAAAPEAPKVAEGPEAPEAPKVAEAEAPTVQVGQLFIRSYVGIGDLGMAVAAPWRGRGVGSALLAAAVEWAGEQSLHKLTLQVWPHNTAAQALYRKFGFVQEGHLVRHYRRRNGELWDALIMGRVLDTTAPGP